MNAQNGSGFDAEVIVVGGGLAGLTAAADAAREGRSVLVLEKSKHLGGMAATQVQDGVHFNLGPRALYCGGRAFAILRDLGVPFTGRFPNAGQSLTVLNGDLMPYPARGGAVLLTSRALSLREKWRLGRLLRRLPQIDAQSLDSIALADWIRVAVGAGNAALVLRSLFRLITYTVEPQRMSAGAAIKQLQVSLNGYVWYLDGGWQTLIDGLAAVARRRGAEIRTSAAVEAVQSGAAGVAVRLRGGETLHARAAVLALAPPAACTLLDLGAESKLARFAAGSSPMRAACLDVALNRLPRPERRAVFGTDRPLYYSVHSAAAKLAPAGVAVMHVMKYLGADASSGDEPHVELEEFLEQVQPGWREHVVAQRFLPSMTVSWHLPLAEWGGLAGRPDVAVAERPHVYLAGDWVGREGMLADAAVASGREAARRALAAFPSRAAEPAAQERSAEHVA